MTIERKIRNIEKRLDALHALVVEFWVEDIKTLQRKVKELEKENNEDVY